MYGQGMSQRDISDIIQDIYGFPVSADTISNTIDRVYPVVDEWRHRPLKKCYPFVFVDCLYVSVKTDRGAKEQAVYVVLGYDKEGCKDILGIWIGESESRHFWMEIFDELKARGIEDIFFLSMDGVSGLESGAKAVFPNVTVQRCIVHILRNSLKYIPNKERAGFCKDIKRVYGALNAKEAEGAFDEFKEKWSQYPGSVSVWERNFHHVLQLFNHGSAVRKIMYTTNAIESVNSSLRKITKRDRFQMRIQFIRLCIYTLWSLRRNGRDERFKTGQWYAISSCARKNWAPGWRSTQPDKRQIRNPLMKFSSA